MKLSGSNLPFYQVVAGDKRFSQMLAQKGVIHFFFIHFLLICLLNVIKAGIWKKL